MGACQRIPFKGATGTNDGTVVSTAIPAGTTCVMLAMTAAGFCSITAGADSSISASDAGAIAADQLYEFCLNRNRLSDGTGALTHVNVVAASGDYHIAFCK